MLTHYISTLDQGISFLTQLQERDYCQLVDGIPSTIGHHVRHILDHFMSLQTCLETGLVNYEIRKRGSSLETSLSEALNKFSEIKRWMLTLTETDLNRVVGVNTDVGIGQTYIVQAQSTLARELIFVSSHAIHHYSTLKMIYQFIGGITATEFGLAPSTASFNRGQSSQLLT
jgi:hypothetical protein